MNLEPPTGDTDAAVRVSRRQTHARSRRYTAAVVATTFIAAFLVWTGLIVLGMASGEARARAAAMQPEPEPFMRAAAEPGRSLDRLTEFEGDDYPFLLNTRISGSASPQQASDAPEAPSAFSVAEDTSAASADADTSADASPDSSAEDAADPTTEPAPSLPATGLGPGR